MVILLQSPSQPLFPNRVLLQFFVKSIVSVNTTETMLCTLWAKYYIVIMFFFLYNFFPLWPNCLTFSFALFSLSLQVFLSVHTSFPPPFLSSPPSLIPFLCLSFPPCLPIVAVDLSNARLFSRSTNALSTSSQSGLAALQTWQTAHLGEEFSLSLFCVGSHFCQKLYLPFSWFIPRKSLES